MVTGQIDLFKFIIKEFLISKFVNHFKIICPMDIKASLNKEILLRRKIASKTQ